MMRARFWDAMADLGWLLHRWGDSLFTWAQAHRPPPTPPYDELGV